MLGIEPGPLQEHKRFWLLSHFSSPMGGYFDVCVYTGTLFFLVASPSMWHGMINILILPVVLESGSIEGLKLTFFPWASLALVQSPEASPWDMRLFPVLWEKCFLQAASSYSHCSELCFTRFLPSDVASFFHGVLWEILNATPGHTHM